MGTLSRMAACTAAPGPTSNLVPDKSRILRTPTPGDGLVGVDVPGQLFVVEELEGKGYLFCVFEYKCVFERVQGSNLENVGDDVFSDE